MKIGLVPMAAKPYHAGHHWLVEQAAGENDKVILFVSVSDRKRKGELPILGADMVKVWQEELEPIMPSNVEVKYAIHQRNERRLCEIFHKFILTMATDDCSFSVGVIKPS